KARLAFAAAINIEPDILIVDEALSVGDAAFQRKCFAKMEQIREAGATILFVSHSESSIVSLCSRAVWISNGEQVIDGVPKLVTGLYMKNASKKVIKKAAVQKEYACLVEKDNSAKKQIVVDEKSKLDTAKEIKEKQPIKIDKPRLDEQPMILEEYFDPGLKPTSTIYYEEKGARISDVKITTLDGREVNALVEGKEYYIEFQVHFFDGCNCVIACNITDSSGVYLSGAVYPALLSYKEYKSHKPNSNKVIKFKFLALLNENNYFLTCIVQNDCAVILHQIKDSYMFRILRNNKTSNAFVNLIRLAHVVDFKKR
ncbi:MAG: Wzt carbohydrate-binding domain-containing protein, partial [Gammaproteobacteria bacterium]|nr:Wzt carbohydrate-binding domain-containing protein [Gammaproteobacteria bacterium]